MRYTVVVFSSRNDTMQFYKIIKNYGLYCTVINTPRSLASSCGVSAKIDARLVNNSITIINKYGLRSFKGIYNIEIVSGREIINKIA